MELRIYLVQGKRGHWDSEGYALWDRFPVTAPSAKVARRVFLAAYPNGSSITTRKVADIGGARK